MNSNSPFFDWKATANYKQQRHVNTELAATVRKIINNYSPKAKLILLNNPRDEVEGIIQQY